MRALHRRPSSCITSSARAGPSAGRRPLAEGRPRSARPAPPRTTRRPVSSRAVREAEPRRGPEVPRQTHPPGFVDFDPRAAELEREQWIASRCLPERAQLSPGKLEPQPQPQHPSDGPLAQRLERESLQRTLIQRLLKPDGSGARALPRHVTSRRSCSPRRRTRRRRRRRSPRRATAGRRSPAAAAARRPACRGHRAQRRRGVRARPWTSPPRPRRVPRRARAAEPPEALPCRDGRAPRRSRRPANANAASTSAGRARSTSHPLARAHSIAASQSVVLPIPASPSSTNAHPCEPRGKRSISASSSPRPTISGLTNAPVVVRSGIGARRMRTTPPDGPPGSLPPAIVSTSA